MVVGQELLLVGDVARMLDCSPSYVYRLAQRGKLKSIRVGSRGVRIYPRTAVDRFIGERKRKAAPAGEGSR